MTLPLTRPAATIAKDPTVVAMTIDVMAAKRSALGSMSSEAVSSEGETA
ncbi:hypothetical protein ABT065_18420 [Streptomyces sp. NPDC002764]